VLQSENRMSGVMHEYLAVVRKGSNLTRSCN